jgi:hypothetical protein
VRCYFVMNGRIAAGEMLPGVTDQEAIEKSHELFAARKYRFDRFEIWDTTRVVFRWAKPETSVPVG